MRRKPKARSKLVPPVGTRVFRRAKGETRRDATIASYEKQGYTLITVYDEETPYTTLYSIIFEYTGG
ncbi:hypothetical protein [Exiguobacterium indicum]|uniref:hypothetical protein n=1 Tax=Exiguobacterium indicum TaxID=296995 RepID=UPI00128F5305|nr:hypothetical protein [Exiguobacterium indicum]